MNSRIFATCVEKLVEREDHTKSYLNVSVNIFEYRVMSHLGIQKNLSKRERVSQTWIDLLLCTWKFYRLGRWWIWFPLVHIDSFHPFSLAWVRFQLKINWDPLIRSGKKGWFLADAEKGMAFRWGERHGRMILSIRRNFSPGCFLTKFRFLLTRSFIRRQARLTALIYWADSASSRSDIMPIKRRDLDAPR